MVDPSQLQQLQQVSAHGWAWFDGSGRWGHANSGLIVEGASGMLVNTRHDVRHTQAMLASIASALPDVRIEAVAVTDAAPHRHWGLGALRGAEPVVSDTAAAEIADAMPAGELAAVAAEAEPGQPLWRYLRETVGGFDLAGVAPYHPAGSFSGRTQRQVGSAAVELIEFGPAHSRSDTVVCLPYDGVMYTGDLLCPGVHPAVRSGSFSGWYSACAQLAALRPVTVVPGHGPATDILGVIDFRDYLGHLLEQVEQRHAKGIPVEEAAVDIPLRHWARWAHPENLAVTVAEIYRQLGDENPLSFTAVTTLSAEIAAGLRPRPRIRPMSPGERDADTTRLLGLTNGETAIFDQYTSTNIPNMITTLVRNPRLYEQTVPIARGVIDGLLDPRHREMAILRSAWNCAAAYQWCHHREVALGNGLSEAEVDLLSRDPAEGSWTRHERAILRAVDELHTNSAVSDATWGVLAAHYRDAELIELVTLVGEYHKVSFQLNTWRVPLEAWAGPFRLPSGWPYQGPDEDGGDAAPAPARAGRTPSVPPARAEVTAGAAPAAAAAAEPDGGADPGVWGQPGTAVVRAAPRHSARLRSVPSGAEPRPAGLT